MTSNTFGTDNVSPLRGFPSFATVSGASRHRLGLYRPSGPNSPNRHAPTRLVLSRTVYSLEVGSTEPEELPVFSVPALVFRVSSKLRKPALLASRVVYRNEAQRAGTTLAGAVRHR